MMTTMNRMSKIPPAKRLLLMSLDDITKQKHIDKVKAREIYENAGLSTNTFYYHFKDKYDCASLLVKYYESCLHSDYTGPIDEYYNYITSGEYILHYNTLDDSSEGRYKGMEMLKRCYTNAFNDMDLTNVFWGNHTNILTNILTSEEQNSPRHEHMQAWNTCFENLLDYVPQLSSVERSYMAHLLGETFNTYWMVCLPECINKKQDMKIASELFRKSFLALLDVIQEMIS